MEISRDVKFDEYAPLKKLRKCQPEETYEEVVAPRATKPMQEVTPSDDNEILEEHDMLEPQEPPHMNIYHKRNPSWVRDIIQEPERYGAPEGSTRKRKRPKLFLLMWL